MILTDLAVRRPVAASCLIIALTLLGLHAWRKMNLELMPQLDLPFITVLTVYPGASPSEIEVAVARRIEDAVMSVQGLKHVTSSAMENACQTLLEFHLGTDVDVAAVDVRERIDLVRRDFPADVEAPQILKFDVNATPIATLALTGDHTREALFDYADNELRDRLSAIPGVADLQLIGGAPRQMTVRGRPTELAARGLTTLHVVEALGRGLRTVPAGRIREHGEEIAVTFDADALDPAAIAAVPVAGEEERRVLLGDVATVGMESAEVRSVAFLDGAEAIAIKIVKMADANAVEVIAAVEAGLERLTPLLPGGMTLHWVSDDGSFITATSVSAWQDIGLGIVLTAAILFCFLYNPRSLLVVCITMPLTIIIGLFFMQGLGYTLNTSTLIAMGMSVGILVTNAIVVLEAIVSRLERGDDPATAARLGAGEAFVAVLASAGTNVVVLLPLLVMPSMVGLFIGPLVATMLIMTVVSLFLSFSLAPMLCALLLRPHQNRRRGLLAVLERGWNRGFRRLVAGYQVFLQAHRRRWLAWCTVLATIGLFVVSMGLGGTLGTDMVTEPDRGEIFVKLEFPTRYDLNRTRREVARAEAALADLPHLRHALTTVGKVDGIIGQVSEGTHLAQILLRFDRRTDRAITITDLMDRTRAALDDLPAALVTVLQPGMIGGQGSAIELEIDGDDLETLDATALAVAEMARGLPGLRDIDTTVRDGGSEIRIRPRRAVLADRGIAATQLGLTLRANLEGVTAGTLKRGDRSYDIVVRLEEQFGQEQIDAFAFPGDAGHSVPLTTLAEREQTTTPVLITRKNKRRITKVLANLEPGVPLGSAVARIDAGLQREQLLPPGYGRTFAGTYEVLAEAEAAMSEAGMIAMVLVVLTLAAILESFFQPALILITVPLALIGVVLGLSASGGSFGIFEMMGMVMLIGIVVNNAILIIDRYNSRSPETKDLDAAMIAAAGERFRPIVMITIAAVLGMLPLAFGRGIGAEIRNGVGIASAAGILASGVLTLLVLPVVTFLRPRRRSREPRS